MRRQGFSKVKKSFSRGFSPFLKTRLFHTNRNLVSRLLNSRSLDKKRKINYILQTQKQRLNNAPALYTGSLPYFSNVSLPSNRSICASRKARKKAILSMSGGKGIRVNNAKWTASSRMRCK